MTSDGYLPETMASLENSSGSASLVVSSLFQHELCGHSALSIITKIVITKIMNLQGFNAPKGFLGRPRKSYGVLGSPTEVELGPRGVLGSIKNS